MKYDKFTIFAFFALLFAQLNSASAATPDRCPSVEAIKQAPIRSWGVDSTHRFYYVFAMGKKYDTNVNNWDFGVYVENAKDGDDAVKKANAALKSLTFVRGPNYYEGYATCLYSLVDKDVNDASARCTYEICY